MPNEFEPSAPAEAVVTTSRRPSIVWLIPVVALVAIPAWAAVVKLTGKASLASIVAVVGAAAAIWFLAPPAAELVGVAAIVVVVVARHASNIKRLVRGEERAIR